MPRMFAFYKLKPDADVEAFKRHMVTLDQPACRDYPGVQHFEVFVLTGTQRGTVPFDVVEVIDVDRYETWDKLCTDPANAALIEAWKVYGDETTLAFTRAEATEEA